MNKDKSYRVIISGGGTGGHIFPAIAIANEIKANFPNSDILFVGAEGKMEMEKVPAAGYKIIGLPVAGFQRSLSFKNLSFPFKLIKSLNAAKTIIKDFKPDFVVGVGGYASGPTLWMAAKQRIPIYIQEQNSYAGITNKLLSAKANKIFVAYDNMNQFFEQKKIVKTGNPVRKDVLNIFTDTAIAPIYQFENDYPTVLLIGGSLGARTINESVLQNLEKIKNLKINFIWQTGKFYYSKCIEATVNYNVNNLKTFEFLQDINNAYKAADIIVSRAGALSISELCVVGKPTILIPSPNVSEDHQTKNAMALVNKNAAVLVKDNESVDKLIETITSLVDNISLSDELGKNIKATAMINATEIILKEILADIK